MENNKWQRIAMKIIKNGFYNLLFLSPLQIISIIKKYFTYNIICMRTYSISAAIQILKAYKKINTWKMIYEYAYLKLLSCRISLKKCFYYKLPQNTSLFWLR